MKPEYQALLRQAGNDFSRLSHGLQKLKKNRKLDLDHLFQEKHREYTKKINCMECANCCRGLGPLLKERDIQRLSRLFKIKPRDFIAAYLKEDEENDLVFKKVPCPFIQDNDLCLVYPERPVACRDFPHTDRKNIRTYLKETLLNTKICPIVYMCVKDIVESNSGNHV